MQEGLLEQTELQHLLVEELLRMFPMQLETLLQRAVMLVRQEMVEQEVQVIVVQLQSQLRAEAWAQQVRAVLHTQVDLLESTQRLELF
jgi:hypothetical protein